jgi:LysR family transcriptional regulator, regulator of peptidoglycan recycling
MVPALLDRLRHRCIIVRINTPRCGPHHPNRMRRATRLRISPEPSDITVKVIVDYGPADIVADRFDASVRLGEEVAKDMIAVPIAPDIPMAIVGSPRYSRRHSPLTEPQHLAEHRCINLRLPTSGVLNRWRLLQIGGTYASVWMGR